VNSRTAHWTTVYSDDDLTEPHCLSNWEFCVLLANGTPSKQAANNRQGNVAVRRMQSLSVIAMGLLRGRQQAVPVQDGRQHPGAITAAGLSGASRRTVAWRM
jgi:hypothetical protein